MNNKWVCILKLFSRYEMIFFYRAGWKDKRLVVICESIYVENRRKTTHTYVLKECRFVVGLL